MYNAYSTAAILHPHAWLTICSAAIIARKLDGTGQAQKLASSCLEKSERSLRVDRRQLLTIQ
jgi:hypothetical protein